MNAQTFTYTISSIDKKNNIDQLINTYEIDFGGFGAHLGQYHCEVKRFSVNGHVKAELGYVLLTCENLHSSGYHSDRPSNEITLCCLDAATLLTTTHGSSFIVPNCSTKRRVKFTLSDSAYLPLTSWQPGDLAGSGEINIDGYESDLMLSLLMTPI